MYWAPAPVGLLIVSVLSLLGLSVGTGKETGAMMMVTPPLVAYSLVRGYDQRRDGDTPKPETDAASALASHHKEIK